MGLGITQLKNETFVYNNKRHGEFELSGRNFSFKRPNNGFPKKLTKEFLFVDLMNNLKFVGEDVKALKMKLTNRVCSTDVDQKLLSSLAKVHGKVGTRKFFENLFNEKQH